MIDHEAYRFGSARFADAADLRKAGLLGKDKGLYIGSFHKRPLILDGDGHGLLIGGAGSGKGRTILVEMHIRQGAGHRWTNDPRGEIAAIVSHNAIRRGAYAYMWNPCGLHGNLGLAQHSTNPLDVLAADDPRFDADCKFFAEAFIPLSSGTNSRYFEIRARDSVECVMKIHAERFGVVTPPSLYDGMMSILSGIDHWQNLRAAMFASRFPEVRRCAAELADKQVNAQREFGGILGTVQEHMACYSDRMLRRSLEGSDFSFKQMTKVSPPIEVYSICPVEYAGIWASATRIMSTAIMLHKSRAPQSPPVTLIYDEAAQLGRFEALLRAYAYMRGFGVRVISVFQDVGQIVRNFDKAGLQGLMGSSQWRGFMGVRDYDTAKLVSDMLGNETLSYKDEAKRGEARRRRQEAAMRFMTDDDPFGPAFDFAEYNDAANSETKMQRPLMTPSEVLAMPEDRMISMVSGIGVPPIYHPRPRYDANRALAGYCLPNPHHGSQDRIYIPRPWWFFGGGWRNVVTERVPDHLAHFPQFQSGYGRYVEGYRPW